MASQSLMLQFRMHLDSMLALDGYNAGWNVRSVGGQEVMHTHLHVLPRFADEPMAGHGIRSCLKSIDDRRRVLSNP